MRKVALFLSAIFLTVMIVSFTSNSSNESGSSIDEVTIGNQVWMAENLNVDTFRNGDPIPHSKTEEEWDEADANGLAAWCYYENNPVNGVKYGKLYNWHAVNDPRGLAPKGWHIPSDEEWTNLVYSLSNEDPESLDIYGNSVGIKMKDKKGWKRYKPERKSTRRKEQKRESKATNESGFSALPGGVCEGGFFEFSGIGYFGNWWSSSESSWSLSFNSSLLSIEDGDSWVSHSVRCVRD